MVYILGNLALGFFLGKKIHTADDYYLGNRTTPWWAIGISVVATYVSALSFLGGPGLVLRQRSVRTRDPPELSDRYLPGDHAVPALLLQQRSGLDLRLSGTAYSGHGRAP